jgi:putative PLP-dependent aminotransferase (TIGR04422 family)
MVDYQWPAYLHPPKTFNRSLNRPDKKTILTIESFFSKILLADAILVPSGRAAINMTLQFLGANRAQNVFAPQFSSHCVWDAISRVSCPTTSLLTRADIVIAVHKWGRVAKLKNRSMHGEIIEDSVDSIVEDASSLFPLGGICEVISLPKVLGSYCGGIVVTKNQDLGKYMRRIRKKNQELGTHQSYLKFLKASGDLKAPFTDWSYLESSNTALEGNGGDSIHDCLGNWKKNGDIIRSRLDKAISLFKNVSIDQKSGRLPPVLAFPVTATDTSVMVRYENSTGYLDAPKYKKCALLPLHFGVTDKAFHKIASQIKVLVGS